jgi:hypothetical protein
LPARCSARIEQARERDEQAIPGADLRRRRQRLPQEHAVGERGAQADAVEVVKALERQPRRRERAQAGLVVAPEVADGAVEGAVERLMRRRQHDEPAARAQVSGGARELGAVVLDVLEDVEVEDRVEAPLGRHVGQGAAGVLAARSQGVRRRARLRAQLRIGLEAGPAPVRQRREQHGVRTDPRPDLQDLAAQPGRIDFDQ